MNLTKWIDTFREEFIANIKKNAAIDIKLIRGDDLEHFKTQHKQAKTLMRQLLSDLSGGITSLRNENDRDKVILELQEAEKQVMKERGRPVVIKAGNIGEPGMPTRMISAAFPQGSESIPSTLRDGKSDTKLSNHVLLLFKSM